jgi:hypothetical protein
MPNDSSTTQPSQPLNNHGVSVDLVSYKSDIPRRAIDYAQLIKENIETRIGQIDPRDLHTRAGEVLEDQLTKSLETDAYAGEILLEADALVVEGIQQAMTHVEAEENSIVAFDAIGGEASLAVTAAIESLAGDELTVPIAKAAIQILSAADTTGQPETA